jgi:ubiquinone/menaquinone biosynthesis C-methylase UbiE
MNKQKENPGTRTTREVFEEWGQTRRADDMADHHWGTVKQAFELISESSGNYLEIGVGNGYGIDYMATHQFAKGKCWGFDLAENMVQRARQRNRANPHVQIRQGDFLTVDLTPEAPFVLIFSMEVFYYFPDIQQGIDKAFSLLQPGGRLWVLVNFYQENPASHTWPEALNTPMTLWSRQDYRCAFEKAGFTEVDQHIFKDDSPNSDGPTLATVGIKPAF